MAMVRRLPKEGEAEVANIGGERRGRIRFDSSPWSGRWAAERGGQRRRSAGWASVPFPEEEARWPIGLRKGFSI
jgi:hypothetical protein